MAKTYKTWEVVKALTENPNLKFKCTYKYQCFSDDEVTITGSTATHVYLKTRMNGVETTPEESLRLDEEWELVQEPVDFMTALAAKETGKRIRSEYSTIFKDNNNTSDDNTFYSLKAIKGKWYIED